MTAIPTLREEDIERLVGRRNLRHGREYYQNGAVIDACRQGPTLRASCVGTGRTPYHLQVTFDDQEVTEARCTCPVGQDGNCKHVAALLTCWLESPETFVEAEGWDTVLGRCSRRELIEIVKRVLDYRPELQRLVEPMLPSQDTVAPLPSLETYRRQAADLLRQTAATPEATARLVEQLLAIKEVGDGFANQHDTAAAAIVYQALVSELLEYPELLDQGQSELLDLLHECTEAISGCLYHLVDEPDSRLEVLRTLLRLYRFEVVLGGIALGVDLPRIILTHVSVEERQIVADWVRGLLPSIEGRESRRVIGGLLLELAADQLDEAAFFDLCRQTDRIFDLVRRLVHLGRVDQALEEAQRADDKELVKIADLLVRYRRDELAQRLVEQRACSSTEPILHQWLQDYQTQCRDRQAMLEFSEKLFRLQPSFSVYRQIRNLARQLGQWDRLHPELLAFIERSGHLALLVRIHLDENDIDRALEVAASERSSTEDSGLELKVARAAERSRPLESLNIYRTLAERLIARRGRNNYIEACRYLRKVRALMKRTSGLRSWHSYLQDLRRRHRPLRVLHEELEAARLQASSDV